MDELMDLSAEFERQLTSYQAATVQSLQAFESVRQARPKVWAVLEAYPNIDSVSPTLQAWIHSEAVMALNQSNAALDTASVGNAGRGLFALVRNCYTGMTGLQASMGQQAATIQSNVTAFSALLAQAATAFEVLSIDVPTVSISDATQTGNWSSIGMERVVYISDTLAYQVPAAVAAYASLLQFSSDQGGVLTQSTDAPPTAPAQSLLTLQSDVAHALRIVSDIAPLMASVVCYPGVAFCPVNGIAAALLQVQTDLLAASSTASLALNFTAAAQSLVAGTATMDTDLATLQSTRTQLASLDNSLTSFQSSHSALGLALTGYSKAFITQLLPAAVLFSSSTYGFNQWLSGAAEALPNYAPVFSNAVAAAYAFESLVPTLPPYQSAIVQALQFGQNLTQFVLSEHETMFDFLRTHDLVRQTYPFMEIFSAVTAQAEQLYQLMYIGSSPSLLQATSTSGAPFLMQLQAFYESLSPYLGGVPVAELYDWAKYPYCDNTTCLHMHDLRPSGYMQTLQGGIFNDFYILANRAAPVVATNTQTRGALARQVVPGLLDNYRAMGLALFTDVNGVKYTMTGYKPLGDNIQKQQPSLLVLMTLDNTIAKIYRLWLGADLPFQGSCAGVAWDRSLQFVYVSDTRKSMIAAFALQDLDDELATGSQPSDIYLAAAFVVDSVPGPLYYDLQSNSLFVADGAVTAGGATPAVTAPSHHKGGWVCTYVIDDGGRPQGPDGDPGYNVTGLGMVARPTSVVYTGADVTGVTITDVMGDRFLLFSICSGLSTGKVCYLHAHLFQEQEDPTKGWKSVSFYSGTVLSRDATPSSDPLVGTNTVLSVAMPLGLQSFVKHEAEGDFGDDDEPSFGAYLYLLFNSASRDTLTAVRGARGEVDGSIVYFNLPNTKTLPPTMDQNKMVFAILGQNMLGGGGFHMPSVPSLLLKSVYKNGFCLGSVCIPGLQKLVSNAICSVVASSQCMSKATGDICNSDGTFNKKTKVKPAQTPAMGEALLGCIPVVGSVLEDLGKCLVGKGSSFKVDCETKDKSSSKSKDTELPNPNKVTLYDDDDQTCTTKKSSLQGPRSCSGILGDIPVPCVAGYGDCSIPPAPFLTGDSSFLYREGGAAQQAVSTLNVASAALVSRIQLDPNVLLNAAFYQTALEELQESLTPLLQNDLPEVPDLPANCIPGIAGCSFPAPSVVATLSNYTGYPGMEGIPFPSLASLMADNVGRIVAAPCLYGADGCPSPGILSIDAPLGVCVPGVNSCPFPAINSSDIVGPNAPSFEQLLPIYLQRLPILGPAAATNLIPFLGVIPGMGPIPGLYTPNLWLLPGMSVIPAISALQGLNRLPGLCNGAAKANATLYNSTVVLSDTAWSALTSATDVHTLSWLSPLAQAYAQLPSTVVQQSAQANALLTYEAAAPPRSMILPGLENAGAQLYSNPVPFLADPTIGFGSPSAVDNGVYLTLASPPLCPLPAGQVPGLDWGGLTVAATTLRSYTCDPSVASATASASHAADETVYCADWTQWSRTKLGSVNSSTYANFAFEPLSKSYLLGTTAGLFVISSAGMLSAVSGYPTNASVQQLIVRSLPQKSWVIATGQNLTRVARMQVVVQNGSAVFLNTSVVSLAPCFPSNDSLVHALLDANPSAPSTLAVCASSRCYQITLPSTLVNSSTCPPGAVVSVLANITAATIPAFSVSGSSLWLVSSTGSVTYGGAASFALPTFFSNQSVLRVTPHPSVDGVAYLLGSRSSVWRVNVSSGSPAAVDVSGNLASALLQEMAQYPAAARTSLASSAFNAASLSVQLVNGSSTPVLLAASPVGVFFAFDSSSASPLVWTKLGGAARAPVTAASLAANPAWTAAADQSLWFDDSVYALDTTQPPCTAQAQAGRCMAADVCGGGALGSSYTTSCLSRPNTVCCLSDPSRPTVASNVAVSQHIAFPAYVASLGLTNDGGLRAQSLYKYVNLAVDQLYRSNGSASSQLLYSTDLASCNSLATYMAVLGQLTSSLQSFDALSKLTSANIAAAVSALSLPTAVTSQPWQLNFPAYGPRVVAWLLTQLRPSIPTSGGLTADIASLVTVFNAQFTKSPGLTAAGVTRAWTTAKTVLGCSARTLQPPVTTLVSVAYDGASDSLLLLTGGAVVDASLASASTSSPVANDAAGVWALQGFSASMAALGSQRCLDSYDALNPAQSGNCLPGTPGCPHYALTTTVSAPSNLTSLDFIPALPGGCLGGVGGCPLPGVGGIAGLHRPRSRARAAWPAVLPVLRSSECGVVRRCGGVARRCCRISYDRSNGLGLSQGRL